MAQQLKDKKYIFFRCLFMALCDYTEHDTLSLETYVTLWHNNMRV